jgi:hypothetical protein
MLFASVMRLVMLVALAACSGRGGAGDCAGLSLEDCRLTAGCKPDTCFACVCNQNYRGCLAETEIPLDCPALGCVGGECCATESQCMTNETCAPPGTKQDCGACTSDPGNCVVDGDCKMMGATEICEPVDCACQNQKECVAGCSDDSQCDAGLACDVGSSRCVAMACVNTCPPNFECASGTCVRMSCASDLDCAGYCVNGTCFEQTGSCMPPAA